jgi:hypothetical protein
MNTVTGTFSIVAAMAAGAALVMIVIIGLSLL